MVTQLFAQRGDCFRGHVLSIPIQALDERATVSTVLGRCSKNLTNSFVSFTLFLMAHLPHMQNLLGLLLLSDGVGGVL